MLKYFNGTTIFTFLNDLSLPLAAADFPKIILYVKDDELSIATLIGFPASFIGDSSLLKSQKLPDVSQ